MNRHLIQFALCAAVLLLAPACDNTGGKAASGDTETTSKPAQRERKATTAPKASTKPAPSVTATATASAAAGAPDFSSPEALLKTWAAAATVWDVDGMFACYESKPDRKLAEFKKEFSEPGMKEEVQPCFAKAVFDRYEPDEPGAKHGTVYFKGCTSKTDGHAVQIADGTWRFQRF